jgi:hypothetical protein
VTHDLFAFQRNLNFGEVQVCRRSGLVESQDHEHFPHPFGPLPLVVCAGSFAVFFAGEGHRSNCAIDQRVRMGKIVVKARV